MNGPVIGPTDDRPHTRLPALVFLALGIAANLAAGCTTARHDSAGTVVPPAGLETEIPIDLETELLIGPSKARELGFRVGQQTQTFPESDSGIKRIAVQGDSVFVLDGRNYLTRLRRADGLRVWRIAVADPLDDIHGVTHLPADGLVLLLAGGNLIVLDDDTGSLVDKQALGQVASTSPIVFGPVLIYGARNGQLVWHSFEVGYQSRAYQISSSIRLDPLLVGNDVAVVASDGTVMVLDAGSGRAVWEKRLLSGVEAKPTAGDDLLYLAGLDQYVWALELQTGRTAWRYLSEARLTCAPALLKGHLYQHIPSEGLVCFAARPDNAPGGKIIWTTPGVRGQVIGEHRNRLLLWDDHGPRLTLLDAERGAVAATVDLPGVRHLVMGAGETHDLYAAGDDGRVIRLVPR